MSDLFDDGHDRGLPGDLGPPPSKRRGRRPKAPVADVGIATGVLEEVSAPLEEQAGKKRRMKNKSPALGVLCDMGLLLSFRGTAAFTGHPHWIKQPQQIKVASEPLQAYLESLPKGTTKFLEEKGLPILFFVGLASLVIPDVETEIAIRQYEREVARQGGAIAAGPIREQRLFARPTVQPPPPPIGANGAGPADGIDPSLVSADPLTPGLDVGRGYP